VPLGLGPLGPQVPGRHDLEGVREPDDDPLHASEHCFPVGEMLIRKRNCEDWFGTPAASGQSGTWPDGRRTYGELSGEAAPEQSQRVWGWPERLASHLELKLITFTFLVVADYESEVFQLQVHASFLLLGLGE